MSDVGTLRGTRTIRGFHAGLWVLMMVLVFAGFWPYVAAYGVDKPRPAAIHLHAAVYVGWMTLLLVQIVLVYRRRVATHRRVGRIGMAYGALVFVMGLVATVVAPVAHVRAGEWTVDAAAAFLIFPLGDMVLFGILFGAAMWYRRKPEIHKRLILLATVALLFAPAARFASTPATTLGFWLFPVALGMGYDFWTRGRIHPAYVAGLALMLVVFTRIFFGESPAWLVVGRAIMQALL